ncbi:protein-L-isoaspartate(D-aspartate) O-methyltransferase [Glaciecola sp. XM2]|uniref:protein-L-isoaspartate(D-aspartate) O-methyltransferase n=1 Tax=Glaciecola sp. XM2 TaxID=1914931 RepID=UPI001BDE21AB|nr:protein-L-isoaspartate(D-aspartate) O-methyltransferase [Glaciecola sp. XM2]MBT1450244.1 protein-L-isoaspartate(D-aspartate) O-methyltransferase [Glaciecola sp. XM2]
MIKPTRKGQQLAALLKHEGISHPRVLEVIASTPRELFIPDALKHKAYENNALPIGQGQTISQPYTVAKMTELLLGQKNHGQTVLEIGTGSGYQTAILAQLFNKVYTVERIKALQFQAKRKMNQLDLHNVHMKHGDGWEGWKSKAPFDAIIVTAAASTLPEALPAQLSNEGTLVLPVGEKQQQLKHIRLEQGEWMEQTIETVKFVPLIAGALS